jgi:single-strand DNA-binding protein
MPVNSVTLIGNLVEDPELRFTPSGVALAKVRFAVNRRYQDRNNDWQEETSFFGGTVWREMAEAVAESLTKGTRVIVTGSLEQRSWETQEGEKRSVIEVRIDDIGPSLRYATATVTKTTRREGDWQGTGVGAGGGGGREIPPGPVGRDDYGPDEAPF